MIKEIQSLNRLETSSFTIEKIVEAGQGGSAFQELLYGDRILLISYGKVIAGLESVARQATEESIRKAACDAGVLEEARVNAVERLRQLFQFAGYSDVKVNIPNGTC